MGTENLKPLEELKRLNLQIEKVTELAGLKPVFFRLEEIAKANPNDFDVQLAVGDVKQHLVNRGTKLKEAKDAKPADPLPAQESVAAPAPVVPPAPVIASAPVIPPTPVVVPPPVVQPPAPPPPPATPISPTSGPAQATPVTTPPNRPVQVPPKPPAPPVVKKQGPPPNWKVPALIAAALLLVILVIGAAVIHKRRTAANASMDVQIATTPMGASVRVNGEAKCTSNCTVELAPGNYQITAFLDGYEPAVSGIAVTAGQPVSLNLTLEAQAQSLRIITDLDQGTVAMDGDMPADLQEGQFILDRVLPGPHTIKVTGKGGEATFSFEIADAKQPVISGPLASRNLDTVLVASFGNQAHVLTSAAAAKLAVNGQPEADTNPSGVDLKNFQAGVDELVIGEGKDQHSVKENFGPAPMLTAFIKSDLNIGTLVVSTGEDDVKVFINNKEYPRHTQRGQIRIPTIGQMSVRVSKNGFDAPPPKTAEVKKGAETRLEFKLTPTPQFSTLRIIGGTPGAEVLIDQRSVGTVAPDGSLTATNVSPGDHVVDIRKDGFTPHRTTKTFRVGEAINIVSGDAVLSAAPPPTPAPATTAKVEPPPPAPKKELPPAPKAGTMADWEDPAAWKSDNGVSLHQGGGFIPYKLPPNGTFTFTVQLVKGGSIFRGGRVRWCLEYLDKQNYALYEMDNKNFWAKVVIKGKTFERTHTQIKDLEKQKSFTIQIDVTPEHIVHKMLTGGDWVNLDSWAETGRNFSEGKFGFLIQGNDEIGLSDFKFQPK